MTVSAPSHVRVAIVGAGFAGLGMAIRSKQAGIDDFVVLERASDLGGTWRDNTYPGCACDVPSHLYSYSFAPNPDWTRRFSPQSEIWDYLRRCALEYGVMPHIRFGHELRSGWWDDERSVWHLMTSRGAFTADVLVSGVGALSEPSVPPIPGLEAFEGPSFHSANWEHEHDLTGARVAVIGTGASAIQFVPKLQPRVERMFVFQRTPPWIVPRGDGPLRQKAGRRYRRFPWLQRLARGAIYWSREVLVLGFTVEPRLMKAVQGLARGHLRRQVRDAELRAKLTPDYRVGCKRILLSDDYYPALTQPNVEVVTDAVREIRPRSVITSDGIERPVDVIVFATGFHVTDMPVKDRLRGRGGLLLAEAWREGLQAYRGTTVAGFPNFFMLVGPNTGLGHSSMVFMIESQVNYVLDCLRSMRDQAVTTVEVRPQVQARYNRELQARMSRTVWLTGGCRSWYLDPQGKNTTLWPRSSWAFRRQTRRFDLANYRVERHRPRERSGVEPQGRRTVASSRVV